MKKIQKTTRPLKYDLNQIPYEYTVEMRNRFKVGEEIELLSPNLEINTTAKVLSIINSKGESILDAKLVQEKLLVELDLSEELLQKLEPQDILRRGL